MKTAYISMSVIAAFLLVLGYTLDCSIPARGLKTGFDFLIKIFPILLLAFTIVGMMQVLIPQELVLKWVGEGSGLKGIFIGSAAGALTPGGPFVCFPIAASIYQSGAGIGTIVAYIAGWGLLSLTRLPFEITFLGVKFVAIRVLATLILPPVAGIIAHILFQKQTF